MGDFGAQKTAPQPGSQEGFLRVRTSELRYEGVLRTVMGSLVVQTVKNLPAM